MAMSMSTADSKIATNRVWFYFLAALLIISGILAIAFPFLGSLTATLWTAIALAIAGIAQIIHALAARGWRGFVLGLLIGLLYIATGAVLWLNPIRGVITLTVFLAAAIAVEGIFECILAFQIRPAQGWFLMLISGIIGIIVGVLIWQQLPSSAVWALGLVLGIDLITSGLAFAALGGMAKSGDATA